MRPAGRLDFKRKRTRGRLRHNGSGPFKSLTLRLKRGMSMEGYWARRVVLDDELSGGEDSRRVYISSFFTQQRIEINRMLFILSRSSTMDVAEMMEG